MAGGSSWPAGTQLWLTYLPCLLQCSHDTLQVKSRQQYQSVLRTLTWDAVHCKHKKWIQFCRRACCEAIVNWWLCHCIRCCWSSRWPKSVKQQHIHKTVSSVLHTWPVHNWGSIVIALWARCQHEVYKQTFSHYVRPLQRYMTMVFANVFAYGCKDAVVSRKGLAQSTTWLSDSIAWLLSSVHGSSFV